VSDSANGSAQTSGNAATRDTTATANASIAGTETAAGASAASANLDTTVNAGAISSDLTSRLKGLADANYAALVDEANTGEIQAATVAREKASDPAVKAFAQWMIRDHTRLRDDGKQLLTRLGLTPQPPADDPVRELNSRTTQALQSAAKGTSFDSTYMNSQVAAHKAVLGLLSTMQSSAANAQLQAMARKAQPMIQSHLDSAQAIQSRLGSGSSM
jgi:putative membrane protein